MGIHLHWIFELASGFFFLVELDFVREDVVQIVVEVLAPSTLLVPELGQGNCSFEVRKDTNSVLASSLAQNSFLSSLFDAQTGQYLIKSARPVDFFELGNFLVRHQNERFVDGSLRRWRCLEHLTFILLIRIWVRNLLLDGRRIVDDFGIRSKIDVLQA